MTYLLRAANELLAFHILLSAYLLLGALYIMC